MQEKKTLSSVSVAQCWEGDSRASVRRLESHQRRPSWGGDFGFILLSNRVVNYYYEPITIQDFQIYTRPGGRHGN